MRIVIAGPPKTGNVWLKCLLATLYGLDLLGPKQAPERANLDAFQAWVAAGNFPDGSIFHQHHDYSDALVDAIEAVPARVVTIIRDPYDAFVSLYHTIQGHAERPPSRTRTTDHLHGKPLDHPDVLDFLHHGAFRQNLVRANEWLHAGRSPVVRYEDLHRDPVGTLSRLADRIAPVDPSRIPRAVETCSAANMRKSRRHARHVRAAVVGDSKNQLAPVHLEIFRDHLADLVRGLGYPVRDPADAALPAPNATGSATP